MSITVVVTSGCWCCGQPCSVTVPTARARLRRWWRCADCEVTWEAQPEPPAGVAS